ncbi:hypothetical protein M407DRAFT_220214 [Tulasnella calospora MUT 4182]|uniref:Major facilitator superfamily (MFS) profile domain-containing protein n=1 Tax=Tulasnella calospora MUT 4182 TaxID=1051891 RepID=A0A0C3PYX4_9AGAM|nr:hypothetical protein M407DRAFT_220214 [Tulasnella calospora MUT 4182]
MSLEVTKTQSLQPSITDDNRLPTGVQTPATVDEPTLTGEPPVESEQVPPPPVPAAGGIQFWLIFIALMVSTFLSAIDLTSVSTALPTIVQDLNGTEFAWVGSAFALGSTAVLPLIGGLAQIFGRRPVVLGSLVIFALGSGLCGGANNMAMLIGGRAVQGIGGGGILAMTEIVVADLVPLRQRGTYMGVIGAVWAIASAIGPPIGGAFSQSNWRWLFYMNLPLTAIAMVLVWFFLHLKMPKDDLRSKMRRMDWIGNLFVIIGTTITVVALTWAGVQHPWSSYQVLVPLILGLLCIVAFFIYEAKVPIEPVVPWELVSNRTSFLGYMTVFLHGIVSTVIIYYLPVYFQGTKMQGPVKSGVSLFGNAFTIAPGAIACGATVAIFNIYRPQNFVGWLLTTVGVGLLALLKVDTSTAQWVGFQLVEGVGLGILYAAPTFPVLAPLPVTETAHALALFTFVRSYSQTWGVTIGATILQNELKKKLPAAFLAMFPAEGVEITYAAIPQIPGLPEPIRHEVRAAFADSLKVIWLTMVGVSALGLLCVLGMKELKMHEVTDDDWGMKEKKEKQKDLEKDSEEKTPATSS